ncbi:SigE family RNA polymerase sigma factor [Streptomyces sp. DG2A-72]|uniref:SigE family RNA polymerase sigma factor n=1 Tax=Streptomyces sp. DG2A-72 TaxID=3051386 RepID=UPI00265C47FF|nr:SigE family RNA polymerase sigma factor [Streptomyces sp. DG2A-72]MDO0935973.1 SigE family RNA polymerase sigma factor [Streptomyces sp. DG2A-72]
MRQVRAGGYEEYAAFAAARAGHLYRSACLLTAGDTHLAEDLVQETLGRLYVRWGRVSRVGNPAGYAQTVLTRTFLAHQRRRSSTERAMDVLPELPYAAGGDTSLRLTLLEALARLPAKDRAVVVLRYWEDRSIEETADAMNTSSAAVRTRCTRALARLRALLGEDMGEYAAS